MAVQALRDFEFAMVVSDKKLKKDTPLRRGNVVMVMGMRQVPASSSDPYLHRTLVVVANVQNGLPQIPKEDNEFQAYLVDPRNLERLNDDEQKHYQDILSGRHKSE